MKSIKINLSQDIKAVELHSLSDWHIGDNSCDMALIKAEVEHIKATPNAYCILNGDLCNTALKTSVSDIYSEKLSPMEQLNMCVELLEPIKEKILLITSGNHENRTYKSDGIEIMRLIARQLDCEDRYCGEGGVLFLRFGKTSGRTHERRAKYSIYATHGGGGGRREGGKINRLADLAQIIDVDIYIHAHTHLPLIFKEGYYRVNESNSSIRLVEKLFVNSSATLNYGGYGQIGCFKPISKANPIIYLNGTTHEMTARL